MFKVPYTTIVNITPHSNAEKLELATIYGYQVVVPKNKYKIGDNIIYCPIDSILSPELEQKLFPESSKIKLHNSRIRQIKIRGLASQGMVIDPSDVADIIHIKYVALETDLASVLEITKYEPPEVFAQIIGKDKQRNKKTDNPLFHKYNGVENIKWFPDLFAEGDEVVIQEKLHGTNCRASILPYASTTLLKRILTFLGLSPKNENCYGSNNVEISSKLYYSGYYGEDIYGKTLQSIDTFGKIRFGEAIYGEIIGPKIQKNYEYGLKENKFVLFDVKILQEDGTFKWLNPDEVEAYAKERGFEFVPVLYKGPFNKEFTYTLTKGNSVYSPSTKVREGIVIKSKENYDNSGNKKALKWINEDYLADKNNTDFH